MEVYGPKYELVAVRKTKAGHFYLLYDTECKVFVYTKRKSGVMVNYEDAGINEADAIRGFKNFIADHIV